MNEWKAPASDIAVMTQVTLARNFADVPFESLMSDEEAAHIISRIAGAIEAAGRKDAFSLARLADMTESERGRLADHYLIDRGLLKRPSRGAAFLSKGSTMSVMVNDEDHVCICGMLPGLQLDRAADLAYQADGWLDATGAYAYDAQFGFLTADPACAGPGMKAAVLMHLPTMRAAGQVSRICQELGQQNLRLKPWREEKGDVLGNLYQLEGTAVIGRAEEDILGALSEAAEKIVACERRVRAKICEQDGLIIEDRVSRSLALIRAAKLMSEREMLLRCSELRTGAALGMLNITGEAVDRLMADMQNASIECRSMEKMTERQRDALRAAALREAVDALLGGTANERG